MTMIIECCSQERTFKRFYGLLAQRFCYINKTYAELFEVGGLEGGSAGRSSGKGLQAQGAMGSGANARGIQERQPGLHFRRDYGGAPAGVGSAGQHSGCVCRCISAPHRRPNLARTK